MTPTQRPRSMQRAQIPPYRYVDTDDGVRALAAELSTCDRYAVDTEFVRERTYFARLSLVQIAWSNGIAIVDPFSADIAELASVLSGPGIAVLHAADQDLEILERACGVVPATIFDTQIAAGFIGMSTPSLQSLVERLLRVRLEKGDQLADWMLRPLGDQLLRYAAGDVAYLLEIHDLLKEHLTGKGRLSWAEEECMQSLRRSRTPVVPEESWWRLKHSRQLHGQQRLVAQNVSAWREQKAQALDLPTRFVLSDLAVVSIANRPPKTRAELEDVRNIDGRHLAGGVGAELLAAIEEGRTADPATLRLPPTPAGETVPKPAVMLAAAWVGERAHQLEIDPALLATRADLAGYLRSPPEGRLTSSWRYELVGEPIRRLISGEAALALEGESTLVLEERSRMPLSSRSNDQDSQ